MAVTDLTNTKWLFNNSLNFPSSWYNTNFNINFKTNNQDMIGLLFNADEDDVIFMNYSIAVGNNVTAYDWSGVWTNEAYKTIEIIGGTDVTNSSLISWLTANATQIQGSSLENTKWRFKDTPDLSSFPAAGTSYSINFTSNSNNYTLLKLATYAIIYNTTEVYTGSVPLVAPSIALSSDELSITDNDGNATGFKVYWDGSTTVAETISKT